MAKAPAPPPRRRAEIPVEDISDAIAKLRHRMEDVKNISLPGPGGDFSAVARAVATKVNATYDDVFGQDTIEAKEGQVSYHSFIVRWSPSTWEDEVETFNLARGRVIAGLQAAIDLLEEKQKLVPQSGSKRALGTVEGVNLHPEIERRVVKLFRDGHYANAVEDACKALNALVKLRSGRDDLDGASLMQTVFSVKAPLLAFNDLANESDRSEQQGMMHLFTGAMLAFRNPRAHDFVQDHPDRALKIIQLVSLLGELLDTAK